MSSAFPASGRCGRMGASSGKCSPARRRCSRPLGTIWQRDLLLHSRQPDGLLAQGRPRPRAPGSRRRATTDPHRPRDRRRIRHVGRWEEVTAGRRTPTSGWWVWLIRMAPARDRPSSRMGRLSSNDPACRRRDGNTILFNMGYESRANLYTVRPREARPGRTDVLQCVQRRRRVVSRRALRGLRLHRGGKARVWVMNADGSSPRALSSGDRSEAFDVTWAPGARILYQQAGNRNSTSSIRRAGRNGC